MGQKVRNNYILDIKNCADLLKETTNTILFQNEDFYNCGGFALGLFTWYRPYNYDEKENINFIIEDYDEDLISEDEACEEIGKIYVNHMVEQGLCREVFSEDDLNSDEYLVAFKASIDDFHYARKLKNGRWFHKMGSGEIEEVSEEDVYDDCWWADSACNYFGPLFLLAVKK